MRPAVGSWRPDGAATNRGAMAARSKKPTGGRRRDAYLAQMRGFLTWLAGSEHGGAALVEPGVRDRAVRDYKRHVQTARHWAPSTVNQALAAINSFYRSIGVGRPEVAREELARGATRALAKADQRRFLRAVEGCPSARDRAIATVFCSTPTGRMLAGIFAAPGGLREGAEARAGGSGPAARLAHRSAIGVDRSPGPAGPVAARRRGAGQRPDAHLGGVASHGVPGAAAGGRRGAAVAQCRH